MIGHHMNGGVIVAAAPAKHEDHHVVLHVSYRESGSAYATGLVHYSQFPAPTEWWVGNYHERLEDAVQDFIERSVGEDATAFAAEITKIADRLRTPKGDLGVTTTVTHSDGSDGAVVVFVDTTFEPDGSDGGPGLRVLINDDPAYQGKSYTPKEEEVDG